MMNQPLHVTDDRLLDLVNHLLSAEEEQLVLSHLEQCGECESRFRFVLAEHETAKSMPEPTAQADGKGMIALPRRRPRRLGAITLLAAATTLIFGVMYFSSHRKNSAHYWIPIAFDSVSLRSVDTMSSEASAAFHAYEQHDASRAVELLRAMPPIEDEMLSSLQRLTLASALVNNRKPSEALDVLERLEIFSLPVRWREQAQWVEYLALRDAGRVDQARARLEKLMTYEGDIGNRARAERGRLSRG